MVEVSKYSHHPNGGYKSDEEKPPSKTKENSRSRLISSDPEILRGSFKEQKKVTQFKLSSTKLDDSIQVIFNENCSNSDEYYEDDSDSVEQKEPTFIPLLDPRLPKPESLEFYRNEFLGALSLRSKKNAEGIKYTQEEFSRRYSDVLCPIETMITANIKGQLKPLHANTITLQSGNTYIAAQGPMSGQEHGASFGSSHLEFWKAAYERTSVIVDLTEKEGSKKIDSYYPTEFNDERKLDGVIVRLKEKKISDRNKNIEICAYDVFSENNPEPKEIHRVHYQTWDDKSVVGEKELLDIIWEMNTYSNDEPPIIHCRAGVGRTGTTITAAEILYLIINKQFDFSNPVGEVNKQIIPGRIQRGNTQYVQTHEQYESIFDMIYHLNTLSKDYVITRTGLKSHSKQNQN